MRYILFTFCSLILFSCTLKTPEVITSKGEPGRLVLVSSDQLYQDLDSIIDDVFHEPQPWLAMSEAYFKVSKMDKDAFRRSFIEYQTILFLVTRENYEELKVYLPSIADEEIEKLIRDKKSLPVSIKNKYATPQTIYFLFAENSKEMENKLGMMRDRLLSSIYSKEVIDLKSRLFPQDKDTANLKYKQIKQKLGMGVALTEKFEFLKNDGDFLWYGERYSNEQLGVFCYKVPYTDTSQFSDEYLFALRDSMTKEQVPGPREGTYMTTSSSDVYPKFSEYLTINNLYAKKLRGWWTIQGEFMGGPYVLYAVLSKDNKYIFIYEGFIYSPNKSKSRNLRTLEALGYTIQ